jgi:tripartite-type tricarboxylate transporter receptor subunit TctC
MQRPLGQSVLVENVTGASGAIGVTKVARANPDGYTLSIGHASSHITIWAVQPAVRAVARHDAGAAVGGQPVVPVGASRARAHDAQGADRLAQGQPGQGIDGRRLRHAGPHRLARAQAAPRRGLPVRALSWRRPRHAGPDIGQIDLLVDQAANSLPQLRGGKIKAYAVLARERLKVAPEIPTVDEAGLPGFYVTTWHGLWAPRGTPAAVVERLNAAAREALATEKVKQRFDDLGQDIPPPEMQTVAALAAFQKAEVERWTPLLKAANLKTE